MKSKTPTKKAIIERYMDLRIKEADIRGKINDLKHFLKVNIMESKECMRQMEELDNSIPAEKPKQQKETEI